MALVIQKYGGTSVASPEHIRNVARRVAATQEAGNAVVVVVSAMAKVTDKLIALAHEVAPQPDPRELDVLLCTGEQQTVALLAMALETLGHKATSFLACQIPIRTDSVFTKARILSIDAERIRAALDAGDVAVVAGFQGIDEEGNLTTLGRGGSDTTAVAVAAALGSAICEIYTDVDGVYTTDPNVCPTARKLDRISYEEMLEMASQGAKVLQTRSVLFAMKYGVPILVKSSFNDNAGTLVTQEEPSMMESAIITGVTYDRDQARITVQGIPDEPGVAARLFSPIAEAGVNVDMILQNASRAGITDMTFTVNKRNLAATMKVVEAAAKDLRAAGSAFDSDVAKVSVIGVGMRSHAGIAAKMFDALSREGINILMVSTSEIKVSCVIQAKYVELAVRALHSAFGLDQENATLEGNGS
jgi:aspartate kinase